MGISSKWLILFLILGLTGLSFWTVWPSDPNRYLPDFFPWPKGRGIEITIPTIEGGTFGTTTINRETMSLGLDLRGGTRLVLEPENPEEVGDIASALIGAQRIIERRVNEFGVAESEVNILGGQRISVQLPGIDPDEAEARIGRTALLQFCEAVQNGAGDVAVVRTGTVQYKSQTCEPVSVLDAEGNVVAELARDADGNIVVEGGSIEFEPWPPADFGDSIVWQPAMGDLDEDEIAETALDGGFLSGDTFITQDTLGRPQLNFSVDSDGGKILEQVTERLVRRNYPLAPFLDGEPILGDDGRIIAPGVQGVLNTGNGVISGLSLNEAQELSTLLNIGAFPIALKVVQKQSVDATLGESAVRDSVIAGEIALLLIMLFMVLYYRLPGLMAALALIAYTSFVLAIFKIWPVTLTLAGVAAFILSIGIAVDANILIFERMKEELRVGRNIIVALEDGFNRAWSSIRDSNISTLITCGILYWFGNQFDESAIKGFAITLAIGVAVSMFSAITVSRTFMRVIVGYRPLARRLWLFVPNLPESAHHAEQAAPAVAGGSDGQPKTEKR